MKIKLYLFTRFKYFMYFIVSIFHVWSIFSIVQVNNMFKFIDSTPYLFSYSLNHVLLFFFGFFNKIIKSPVHKA